MASNLGSCQQCGGDLCERFTEVCCMACGLPVPANHSAYAEIARQQLHSPGKGGLKSPGMPRPQTDPALVGVTVSALRQEFHEQAAAQEERIAALETQLASGQRRRG